VIFNSVTYLIFLTIVVTLFWALPKYVKLWLILCVSIIFYGLWHAEFLIVMFISTGIDYLSAIKIERTQSKRTKKIWLLLSISTNLCLLIYFKYLYFLADTTVGILSFLGYSINLPVLNVLLPLGISFYTFEAISYVVDVYRKFIPAEKNFILYACFITFFPKLIAGPILRSSEIIPQFLSNPIFRVSSFSSGLTRIIYGLFLKVVIADNIAPLVDSGFAQSVESLSAIDVWTLAFLFGFQIYFDFSAYSSIAIGSALLLSIHVPENFNYPYLASSPREFWHRWHISLSSWIRDYLYFPLQGIKVKDRSTGGIPVDRNSTNSYIRHPAFALVLTWSIMGLWHGANWTFLFWGLHHAILILFYRISLPIQSQFSEKFSNYVGWFVTVPLVMLGWIWFRAESVGQAMLMFEKIFLPNQYLWLGMRENTYLISALIFLGVILAKPLRDIALRIKLKFAKFFLFVYSIYMSIIIALTFIFLRPISQFIYFQF